MTTHDVGYQVERATGIDPRSEAGMALFASLLGGDVQDVETFDVDWGPGDGHDLHHHDGGHAVAITGGSVTFGFGAERESLEAHEGDYVLIGAGTLHDEVTREGVRMVGARIGPLATYDA